jgi:hypothetical protein
MFLGRLCDSRSPETLIALPAKGSARETGHTIVGAAKNAGAVLIGA